MAIKIHLDTDLGGDIDDLCALAMLLRWPEKVEITGITTVAEQSGKRAGYTRYILALEDRLEIPVAAGADQSQGFYPYPLGFPPDDRYWPEPILPQPGRTEQALELLKASIQQGARIVAIGPYTNLHLLEQRYPGILRDADLYLMGGFIYPIRPGFPQWENDMDFNIQVDTESARAVFTHAHPTLVPLTVTVETALRRADLPGLRQAGLLGQLIARQAEEFAVAYDNERAYGLTCSGLPDDTINFQHDPLACAIALGWREGVELVDLPISVKEAGGMLTEYVDHANGQLASVVTGIDGSRFSRFWVEVITGESTKQA